MKTVCLPSKKQIAVFLLLLVFIAIRFPLQATVFVTNKAGVYSEAAIWNPFYPGNIVKETDTLVISTTVEQNIDMVVKGTVIIKETGSLIGEKNVIIIKSGTFLNLGNSEFGLLTNRGAIYNQKNLAIKMDFVNSGNVINHNTIVVGNLLDNTGLLTGKEGAISAKGKFVNSRTGSIKGNLDVCSTNFLNVEGGTVDIENTTFCGNPIFNSDALVSQYIVPAHLKNSASPVSIRGGEYTPF